MAAAFGVLAALMLLLAWLFLGGRGRTPEPTARRRPDETIDYTELEQAERDVHDAADEDSVRDWGPGTGIQKPPIA